MTNWTFDTLIHAFSTPFRSSTSTHAHYSDPPPGAHTYCHKKSFSLDSSSAAATVVKNSSKSERYRCIVPYPPSSDYELELKPGDTIMVSRKRDNGWYKGKHERTGNCSINPLV